MRQKRNFHRIACFHHYTNTALFYEFDKYRA
ncbi:hypothetical protein T01_12222 [Trichinella spiralis]|uniref:Uncharacterized protein n=1 Tax=Trichinella spiralis TaxID=6334 RepID=A0A0V1AHY3_TRISP|nr:hypothetical protein T01_12222 [Trichinella spiralis]